MKVNLYSVYDVKAKMYYPPQCAINRPTAMRMFQTQFSRPGSNFHDYPQDFDIYECGVFDDERGRIDPYEQPTHVCAVSDLIDHTNRDGVRNNDNESN